MFGLTRDGWDNWPVKVAIGLVLLRIILEPIANLLGQSGINFNYFGDWYFIER